MVDPTDHFIEGIRTEVFDSAAINHPYLSAMSNGDFPNMGLAFQDFALQYGIYSANFSHYLAAVLANLSNPTHKQTLLDNLAEEQGHIEGVELPADVLDCIDGIPHARLFSRFQQALGVNAEFISSAPPCQAGHLWSQQFLASCKMNEYVGIGAIGIGTELIVSRIYDQILTGLKAHSNLTIKERVFFDLHCQCDDQHALQALQIARDLGQDSATRKQIVQGARLAIDMRVAFWDVLQDRAQRFPAPNYTKAYHLAH